MRRRDFLALTLCTAAAACRKSPAPASDGAKAGAGPADRRSEHEGSGAGGNEDGAHLVQREALAMGSSLNLIAWTEDRASAEKAFDEVFVEFDRLDRLLSIWKDGSDVVRVNAEAGRKPVKVSAEFRDVVAVARQISEWTGGKFDVTFGALSDIWRFDQDQDNRIPDAGQIADRLPLVNYRALTIDEQNGTAFLERGGMRVHLGGIGKGYAIDRAVAIMRSHGLRDFLIQAGGDLYAGGRRGDRPWRLGINDPRGQGGDSFATIELSDRTFSTSGDYERFFMKDGIRYHHILDPDTGQPARGNRSVTIVTERAVIADGLSTGVFILGPERGLALLEQLPGVEGVIVSATNQILVSSGLNDRLTIVHLPVDSP